MKIFSVLFCFLWLLHYPALGAEKNTENNYTRNNRYPLLQKPYMDLPIGTIKPKGWLKEQLNRMQTGMTGHLDTVYEKVMGKRNGWLGGDGDVWERGPYWIDGLLPLAYILEDKELIEKVQPWIEWALASQKEDGYFGPDTDREYEEGLQRDNSHDWWPKMVVLKIMQQYYSVTNDPRVIDFMTKYFKYQLKQLPDNPLGKWTFWAEQRAGDNLAVVYWLYNITGDRFLLDLGHLLHKQAFNWTDVFLNQNHLYRQNSMHCVNLGQGFKEPVIYYQQNKDPKQLEAVNKAADMIRNTIGLPTGLWAGDELIRFGDPTYGSELCTAVEMMFSLEEIIKITGDMRWADYLERVAYNALPTQSTDNYDARQYYQQTNQVEITKKLRNFSTPHGDTDILMGVLTGYPCCTSNMHQGWPKLVQNLWYATVDNGLAALIYAPSNITTEVAGGIPVKIEENTNYPFEETVRFKVNFPDKKNKKATFPLHLRIPEWCKNPTVQINGTNVSGEMFTDRVMKINREWNDQDELVVEFPAQINVSYWYAGAAVIERGPLIYALKMDEQWAKKEFGESEKQYGEWYYEVTSSSPWNFSLLRENLNRENLNKAFIVEKKETISAYPWTLQDAPITIKTKARKIPSWQLYNGSAGPVNYLAQLLNDVSPVVEEIELIPYGCTTLRITEFPVR